MPSKYDGKVVDSWFWENDKKERIEVKLRLIKKSQDEKYTDGDTVRNKPPFETLSTEFSIKLEKPKVEICGTDCEALRQYIWAELKKEFAIKWERYYRVSIRPESPYRGLGTGFTLEYHDIEKGTTHDGEHLLREYRNHGYEVMPWPGEFTDRRGRVQACIPDTKINRKGLEEFAKRIVTLREQLAEFLEPEVIQKNLAGLASRNSLPPVDDKLLGRADDDD